MGHLTLLGAGKSAAPSGGGGGGYVGPGDVNGAAYGYWGLRGYTAAYSTGSNPALDLVDSAGANSITINILANGNLDVGSITPWIALDSANRTPPKIAKIYDHTGNGNHLVATTTSQPTLTLNAIGSLPGITFTGAAVGGIVKSGPSAGPSQPFTISMAAKRTATSAGYQAVIGAGGGVQAGFDTAANGLYIYGGSGPPAPLFAPDNVSHAVQYIYNGATSTISSDGVTSGSLAGGTGNFAGPPAYISMGRDTAFGSNALIGVVYEMGVWAGDKSANTSAMNANQHAYWTPAPGDAEETTDFLARVAAADPSHPLTANEIAVYKYLINGLVSEGLLAKMPAIYFLATQTEIIARLNLRSSNFTAIKNGSLSFAPGVGYTGDGSSGYLDTQWSPLNHGTSALDSIAIGAYIQSTSGTSTTVVMGTNSPGGSSFLYLVPVQGGNFYYNLNDGNFDNFSNTNPKGAWIASRTGTNTVAMYKDAATTADTGTGTSNALPTAPVTLFARNDNTIISNFCPYQASAFFIANVGLTSTEAFKINNWINNALGMLTVPKPVYGAFSLTYQSKSEVSGAGSSTVNYGTMTYGAGNDRVIIAIGLFASPATVISVTVNGVSASPIAGASVTAGNFLAALWQTDSAVSGSSGTVSVTYGATPLANSVVYLYKLNTPNVTASAVQTAATTNGTSVTTASLTVPSGGAAAVFCAAYGGVGSTTIGLTNATLDDSLHNASSTDVISLAAHATASATIGASSVLSTAIALTTAAWGP